MFIIKKIHSESEDIFMKCSTFLSLLLSLALITGIAHLPAINNGNYGVSVCEENPLDYIVNDD